MLMTVDSKQDIEALEAEDVVRFTHGRLREALDRLPAELRGVPEHELELLCKLNPTDWDIRHRFWDIINKAQDKKSLRISAYTLCDGFCSPGYFYQNWMANQVKLAWTLAPIESHKKMCEEGFHHAVLKLKRFIAETSLTNDNVHKFLKVAEFLANRGVGPVLQRVRNENLNVDMTVGEHDLPEANADDVIKKLDELRAKLLPAKDVTPQNVKDTPDPE